MTMLLVQIRLTGSELYRILDALRDGPQRDGDRELIEKLWAHKTEFERRVGPPPKRTRSKPEDN